MTINFDIVNIILIMSTIVVYVNNRLRKTMENSSKIAIEVHKIKVSREQIETICATIREVTASEKIMILTNIISNICENIDQSAKNIWNMITNDKC